MKSVLMCVLVAGLAVSMAPTPSEAKRLGGGKSYGMQRNTPDKPAPNSPATPAAPSATPNAPAAAPVAGAAAAAAAPKRSWMGPLAGLAAGLGLAALLGHFGLGGEFASFMMMALLAVVGFFVIRLLMRRFAGGGARGLSYAAGGAAGSGGSVALPVRPQVTEKSALDVAGGLPGSAAAAWSASGTATAASAPAWPAASTASLTSHTDSLPAGFDTQAFERIAKMIFIRMQAANDAGDLDDLRRFTTPEMFAALRLELQERGAAAQNTDVVTIEATVLDYAEEAQRQIVSVHFKGLLREESGAEAAPFDEVWHLVKPIDGSTAWAIAGVQQLA